MTGISAWTTGSRFGDRWEDHLRAGKHVEVFTMGIKHEVFLSRVGGLFRPGCKDCEWVGEPQASSLAMEVLTRHVTPVR